MLRTTRIALVALFVLAPTLAQAVANHGVPEEPPAAAAGQVLPRPSVPAVGVDLPLTGQPWRLVELAGEPMPDEPAEPHLLFMNNGELIGFGGCNYFFGKYRTDDDGRIIVSSLRATHRQCPESSHQETTLLTSLMLADAVQLADEQLTFLLNGSNLLKLRVAPDFAVAELIKQGGRLKARKTRVHKARSKKKKGAVKSKGAAKAKGSGKKATPKKPVKPRPVAKAPVQSK
jgi:heat shock protein HslJ